MSLTIIDNISPPSPRWVYEPPPLFKTELDAVKYYLDVQYPRWINGHSGLTGPHYFYIQECHLKDMFGTIFHPEWRDVDEFIFAKIQDCLRDHRGLLVYKRREVGATSIFAGGMPFWFARTNPGILINLTSKDRDGFVRMFDDKILTCYENMSPYVMNPVPTNKNNTSQNAFLKVGMKRRYADGTIKDQTTTFNLVETSEKESSVTKFSGSRALYTYIDEAPLHKRIKSLLRSMEAVQMSGTEKAGFLAMAGTVEHTLTNEQILAFQRLLEDVKVFDIDTLFVPGWMGLKQCSVNGHSDEKLGTQFILETLEKKMQSSDSSDARAWRMNYPLYESDIFQYSSSGLFEEDVEEILKKRLEELAHGNDLEGKYKLFPYADGYEAKPNKDGNVTIIEMPKPGIIYYIAVDSIGAGTNDGKESGSEFAAIVFKGFDPAGNSFEPVAFYKQRPKTVEDAYIHTANLLNFYNKHGMFKEINYETNIATGDHFGVFLKKTGLWRYAAGRRDLSGKGHINTEKKGQPVNEYVIEWQVKQANVFLRRYGHLIRSKSLLLDLLKPSTDNSDMRSAFFMFMISIWDFDKPVVKTKRKETVTVTKLVNEGGYNVYRQYEVPKYNHGDDTQAKGQLNNMITGLVSELGPQWYSLMSEKQRELYQELTGMVYRK